MRQHNFLALGIASVLLAGACGGLLLPAPARALDYSELVSGQVRSASSKVKHFSFSSSRVKGNPYVTVTFLAGSQGVVLGSEVTNSDGAGDMAASLDSETALPGTVAVRIKPRGYLARLVPEVNMADTGVQPVVSDFIPGDANDDNVIDGSDLTAVSVRWNDPAGGAADINADGLVNSLDFALVRSNQNQKGE